MLVTAASLDALRTVFRGDFNTGFKSYDPMWSKVATLVPSSSRSNTYGWLREFPKLREWIGDRVVHSLEGKAFAIVNKTFEETLGVSRDDFEDDQYGIYSPVVAEMGQNAAELPDMLSIGLLKSGESQPGYDGQLFFGPNHVTYDPSGSPVSYNNLQEPVNGDVVGPAWYLICNTRALKPVIVQRRRPFVLTPRMNLQDPTVFSANRFLWGVDGRMNAGYGMWQMIIKSYAPLTPFYYAAVRSLMMSQHRRDGTPFGIMPNLLLHPPSLTYQARELLISELVNTTSNPWKGSAEPLETTWLS